MHVFLLSFLVCATLASCSGCGSPSHEQPKGEDAAPVPVRELARGTQSAARAESTLVVREGEDWLELWRQHASTRLPAPEVPHVDFTSEMVIGVVRATCPSGGYGVEIRRVERGEGRLRVVAQRSDPEPGRSQTMALTKPFHFVAVPRSDEPVDFAWE